MAGDDVVNYATKLHEALECEGEADSRVETAPLGVAGGISERGECEGCADLIDRCPTAAAFIATQFDLVFPNSDRVVNHSEVI